MTSEIDIFKDQAKNLTRKQKIELVEFLTRELRRSKQTSQQLRFGKYSSSSRQMSTAEDFQIAEWHPAELNGN